MRSQAGFLTEEEEARHGADEGGVGNAVDGEVEACVPLGVQIIQRRDRSGRSGADPRSGRGCGGVGADPPSCEVREGGAGVDLAKHTPVQRQHLGLWA